jgi:nucleoid-associated protein YgaU
MAHTLALFHSWGASALRGWRPAADGADYRGRTTMAEATQDEWDSTQWHEVKKGETLWKIAEHYYGDGSLYPKIFEANKDTLVNPDRIKIGQRLRIP